MKFYTISTFILIGGFIQNVYSEEVKKIEELTVSASPIGLQSLEHCAAPFTILDGEELRGRQDSTIGETLSNIPGITIYNADTNNGRNMEDILFRRNSS